MSKIHQYDMYLICKCVGRPSMGTGGSEGSVVDAGRIICDKTISIPINRFAGPMSGTDSKLWQKETQPYLDAAGWKKLKTLGYFQRLCPDCSKYVLNMRTRDKNRWG